MNATNYNGSNEEERFGFTVVYVLELFLVGY